MDILVSLFSLLLCFLLPIILILGIAYFAAQSRKKKQDAVLSTLPKEAEIKAAVRYNIGAQQGKFLKLKAFQGSGIIYILGDQLVFQDTLGVNSHTFDLKNINLAWVDVNLVNGLLKWFEVKDESKSYYFNIESGIFIFNIKSDQPTTLSVYKSILAYKERLNTTT